MSGSPHPLTPDQVAERWNCSAETVRQLIKRGKLQGFRVGRMFRIPAAAVEEFEAWQTFPSDATVEGGASLGSSQTESGPVLSYREARPRKSKPKP
ncbi:helix-turn-helix domain-containing protein [Salipiger profundus]|uniref:helix-turn-helix domain-containing protein n=1 Tax=Salipiger profundus TaxID=1229727 RepID=UPI003BFA0C08